MASSIFPVPSSSGVNYTADGLSSRPAASADNKGKTFYATNSNLIYISNGTTWYPISDTTEVPEYIDYLVVAGGGGGGSTGGGGGAGGMRCTVTATGGSGSLESSFGINRGTNYTVTVGAGGAGGTGGGNGTKGSDSVFATITSEGGGWARGNSDAASGSGGSGGGGPSAGNNHAGGTGQSNQGFNGGSGGGLTNNPGGGGGGASAVGDSRTAGVAGSGGAGRATSITGSSVTN